MLMKKLVQGASVAAILIWATVQAVSADTVVARARPCLDCHGDKGSSPHAVVPSLGGQPAPYLLIQLYLFREKQRASTYKKDERMVDIMSEMTRDFTDDDLRP